jgi:ribosomal protein L7/L12
MEEFGEVYDLQAKVQTLEKKVEYLMRFVGAKYSDDTIPAVETDVIALLRQDKEIEAIKVYREATGMGLKEAKDAVEAIARAEALR